MPVFLTFLNIKLESGRGAYIQAFVPGITRPLHVPVAGKSYSSEFASLCHQLLMLMWKFKKGKMH